MLKKLLFVLLMPLALTALAQDNMDNTGPGAILEAEFRTTSQQDALTDVILEFYPSTNFTPAVYDVDEYAITFQTQNIDDSLIEIDALLYVPRVDTETVFPVYVFGAGTTGLVNECAPSLEQPEVADWGRFRDYLRTYATQGYITIMPDYAGFNDPEMLQPYYVAELQGRVALDAGRAVYNFFESEFAPTDILTQPFDAMFIGGYSQGGTTVFGARDIHADYAPELPFAGGLSYGSVTDQKNHMLTRPEFSAYRWVAWEQFYGEELVDLDVIFQDLWLPTVRTDATTMCVREAFNFYPADPSQVYRPAFYEALVNDTVGTDFSVHDQLLVANSPGFVASDIPVMILQGELDETIPPAQMAEFMAEYCALDGNVATYNEYLSVTHFDTREVSYLDTLNWMNTVATGGEVPNDCPNFTS